MNKLMIDFVSSICRLDIWHYGFIYC